MQYRGVPCISGCGKQFSFYPSWLRTKLRSNLEHLQAVEVKNLNLNLNAVDRMLL
jgi:hypothetical protein